MTNKEMVRYLMESGHTPVSVRTLALKDRISERMVCFISPEFVARANFDVYQPAFFDKSIRTKAFTYNIDERFGEVGAFSMVGSDSLVVVQSEDASGQTEGGSGGGKEGGDGEDDSGDGGDDDPAPAPQPPGWGAKEKLLKVKVYSTIVLSSVAEATILFVLTYFSIQLSNSWHLLNLTNSVAICALYGLLLRAIYRFVRLVSDNNIGEDERIGLAKRKED